MHLQEQIGQLLGRLGTGIGGEKLICRQIMLRRLTHRRKTVGKAHAAPQTFGHLLHVTRQPFLLVAIPTRPSVPEHVFISLHQRPHLLQRTRRRILFQSLPVLLKHRVFAHVSSQLFGMLQISAVKEFPRQRLEAFADIPILLFIHFLKNQGLHPATGFVVHLTEVRHDVINGLINHLPVVQLHPIIGLQAGQTGHLAQEHLQERVDRSNRKMVVIFQDTMQLLSRPAAHPLGSKITLRNRHKLFYQVAKLLHSRPLRLMSQFIKFLEDARLHFGSGLIRKSHRQNGTRATSRKQQRNITGSQRKSLSASCRGIIHS